MKQGVRAVIGAAVVIALGACASTQLNVGQLEDPTFELSAVRLWVHEAEDEDRAFSGLMDAQLTNIVGALDAFAEQEGARIDSRAFVDAYNAGDIEVQFEEIQVSANFSAHAYRWELAQEADQYARLSITFVSLDGQIPATLVLAKQNPEDPENPLTRSIDVEFAVDTVTPGE